MISTQWLFGFGPESEESLDRPSNNFDIAGVPQGKWYDGIFACYKNLLPSCLVSFCCPCLLWAQVVVRSQIPLLIAVKNSMSIFRGYSGYGFFMNSSLACFILFFVFLFSGIFVTNVGYKGFSIALALLILSFIMFVFGHVRTAFKMKYFIPSALPKSWEVFDMILDAFVAVFCLPCATAQMARHVFQYNRWNPSLRLYLKDPYSLPPLIEENNRYQMADRAGLVWLEDGQLPNTVNNHGSAHRPPHVLARLNQQDNQNNNNNNSTSYHDNQLHNNNDDEEQVPVAHAEPYHVNRLYHPDGTLIR